MHITQRTRHTVRNEAVQGTANATQRMQSMQYTQRTAQNSNATDTMNAVYATQHCSLLYFANDEGDARKVRKQVCNERTVESHLKRSPVSQI